jgi:hypothetical protein
MLRTFFWSLKKSSRLRKISQKLTPKPDAGESLIRSFAEGGFDAIGTRLNEVEEGKIELFELLREDPETKRILEDHKITDEDLKDIYNKLIRSGAGVFLNGHLIPASSLAFGQTLDFVLRHRNDTSEQFKKTCYRLRQYFAENETGEIEG